MSDHVEVLRRMLAEEDVMADEADDAMRAAIAALELQARVNAAQKAIVGTVNERGEPDYIWLQVHGNENPAHITQPADIQADGVSWCWEPIYAHDVMYVRADLVAPPAQGENDETR